MDALSNSKAFTPSLTSSGYGSEAISMQTLSSEDSSSVQSMNVDELNDLENKLVGSSLHFKKSRLHDGFDGDHGNAGGESTGKHSHVIGGGADVPDNQSSLEERKSNPGGELTEFGTSNNEKVGEETSDVQKISGRKLRGDDVVVNSKVDDDVAKSSADVSLDFYSESAMTELEGISNGREDATFSSSANASFSTPVKTSSTSGEFCRDQTPGPENADAVSTNSPQISIHLNAEGSAASEGGTSTGTSGGKPRIRGGNRTSGKSAPMKATYRPASMNLDAMAAGDVQGGSSCEDLYSGL